MKELAETRANHLTLDQLREIVTSLWDVGYNLDFRGIEPYKKEQFPPEIQRFFEATGAYLTRTIAGGVIVNNIMLRDETEIGLFYTGGLQEKSVDIRTILHYLQYQFLATLFPNNKIITTPNVAATQEAIIQMKRERLPEHAKAVFMRAPFAERTELSVWLILPQK